MACWLLVKQEAGITYVEKLFDIVYKDNQQMLHKNIQRLFSVDKGAYYNTRQFNNMKQVYIRITLKSKCKSIYGGKRCTSLHMHLRNSITLPRF